MNSCNVHAEYLSLSKDIRTPGTEINKEIESSSADIRGINHFRQPTYGIALRFNKGKVTKARDLFKAKSYTALSCLYSIMNINEIIYAVHTRNHF